MSKKILLIIGILVLIGIAGFFILTSTPQENGDNRVGFSLREFLPFGQGDTSTQNPITDTENSDEKDTESKDTQNVSENVPRLRKLSGEPVAGAVIFNTGTTSVIRFVEKGTGNVYEANSKDTSIKRLTNTTIPKIIRSFWLPDGSGFLAQTFMDDYEVVETSLVKLNKNTATSSKEDLTPFSTTISKLPTGIKEISIKPDGTKIFYYLINSYYSNWFISNPDGTKSSFLSANPLTEWVPKWVSANTLILQNKGSYQSAGYLYSFDISNKVLKKISPGITGLSSNPSGDGSMTLASFGGTFPKLALLDNKKLSYTNLDINTLAEKCVWPKNNLTYVYCSTPRSIPDGAYPDSWHMGLVSTEDSILKVDLINNVYYTIADLSKEANEQIDGMSMLLSPDNTHLIFQNKKDGFLWVLRIEE